MLKLKKIKRFVALLIAFVLVLPASTIVFAIDILGENNTLSLSTSQTPGESVTLAAYPGETEKAGQMWRSQAEISRVDTYMFRYSCDVTTGMSGGPILNSKNQVVGICSSETPQYNQAVRIIPDFVNWLGTI